MTFGINGIKIYKIYRNKVRGFCLLQRGDWGKVPVLEAKPDDLDVETASLELTASDRKQQLSL